MGERERDPLGVTIGTREIYDAVVGLRDDVRSLTHEHAMTRRELADHEARLRAIERYKYAVPLTGVTAVGGAVAALIAAFGKG
ncbi:hypothetical protein ABT160_23580 [Streptomyces sp. NPDC001941]|uniref:hypothetical protein n=1 Tax=Streptomyces sp. NPDC001941 TaxID=3154659 RepID=UPI0033210E29